MKNLSDSITVNNEMQTVTISLFIKKLLMIALAFLLPIKGVLLVVGLLIFADTFTGIYKAKKKKEKITSRKLSHIGSKMLLYQSAIVVFYMIDKFILGDILSMFISGEFLATKLVAFTFVAVEIKSIDENIEAVTGVSMWDRFKKMLQRAKEIKQDVNELKD